MYMLHTLIETGKTPLRTQRAQVSADGPVAHHASGGDDVDGKKPITQSAMIKSLTSAMVEETNYEDEYNLDHFIKSMK